MKTLLQRTARVDRNTPPVASSRSGSKWLRLRAKHSRMLPVPQRSRSSVVGRQMGIRRSDSPIQAPTASLAFRASHEHCTNDSGRLHYERWLFHEGTIQRAAGNPFGMESADCRRRVRLADTAQRRDELMAEDSSFRTDLYVAPPGWVNLQFQRATSANRLGESSSLSAPSRCCRIWVGNCCAEKLAARRPLDVSTDGISSETSPSEDLLAAGLTARSVAKRTNCDRPSQSTTRLTKCDLQRRM